MKKVVLIVLAILIILIIIAFIGLRSMMRGPDLSSYESLREPRISTMASQKMLIVELKGDPNVVGGKAFGALFKTFYQLKGVPKGGPPPAPRARWPLPLDTPKGEWVGIYGMPLPAGVEKLPDKTNPIVKMATWEYGTVAEILHVGPYSEEVPTVEKLVSFIKRNGYQVIGNHEEEYLKGPGMFGKGDAKKYYTIIRYRLEKAPTDTASTPIKP
jgi:GyrI-like small molecule binding domain